MQKHYEKKVKDIFGALKQPKVKIELKDFFEKNKDPKDEIFDFLKNNIGKMYTIKDLTYQLEHSDSQIRRSLNKLLEDRVIKRKRDGKSYYYFY